jgi:hypothetical protein
MSLDARRLDGWIPIRIYWEQNQPRIDWCWVGGRRFTEPFLDHTIDACLRLPFANLFRPQTPVGLLRERYELSPGLSPQGFIFHMSRCGSTLVTQMLAALPENVVISEAGTIDSVLRARCRDPHLSDEERIDWLRWTVSALGQSRDGEQGRLFIKFDSWTVLDFPLIRRAFPEVPWIFLYRNPIEVLVSQFARRGAHMVPGAIEPELFGMSSREIATMPPEEYCARVLARVCEAALTHHQTCGGMMINYEQLPEVSWTGITELFGIEVSDAQREIFRRVAKRDAKNPMIEFESDSQSKQESASEALREASARWLLPVYDRLQAARSGDLAS